LRVLHLSSAHGAITATGRPACQLAGNQAIGMKRDAFGDSC
jgi:hypothetical protein